MHAWLRVEVDNSDPVAAANDVNTRMAQGARAREGRQGLSTRARPRIRRTRYRSATSRQWRVSQTLQARKRRFLRASHARLEDPGDDGLVLSG
jgi:hypothetical protein